MKSALSLIALIISFFCASSFQAHAEDAKAEVKPSELSNTSWSLVSISTADGDQALPEKHTITLKIDGKGTVSGHAGVNRYFGSVKIDGNKLSWSPMGCTRMAGEKELMDAESLFLKSVAQTTVYERKDETLTLSDETTKTKVVLKASKDEK